MVSVGLFVVVSLPLDGAGVSPDEPYYGHLSSFSLGTYTQMDIHTNATVIVNV